MLPLWAAGGARGAGCRGALPPCANANWGKDTNARHLLDTPESCQQKPSLIGSLHFQCKVPAVSGRRHELGWQLQR